MMDKLNLDISMEGKEGHSHMMYDERMEALEQQSPTTWQGRLASQKTVFPPNRAGGVAGKRQEAKFGQ